MKFSIDEFRAWPNKNVTLLGMSGVGKTYLSSLLCGHNWFHYSGDYRIGTRYMDDPILDMIKQAIVIGAALLGVAIVVIIGNTIRLDIQNRREEIEVTKLIGASNAFVRRPFVFSGFWYGLFGGLLALGLVQYGLYLLEQPAARLAGLYQSAVTVLSLSISESASILGVGVLLGLVGSWFAAARHMRRIEPR